MMSAGPNLQTIVAPAGTSSVPSEACGHRNPLRIFRGLPVIPGSPGSEDGYTATIPLRDVIPSRTTPFVTVGLIIVNSLVYLYEFQLRLIDDRLFLLFLRHYGSCPRASLSPPLFTSMFLHGGWLHVIGNMWFLWIFGDNVEDRLGHGRFLLFYLACGVAAALVQIAVDPCTACRPSAPAARSPA